MTSAARRAVLDRVAGEILDVRRRRAPQPVRVGIDAVDGAGKTRFADDLRDRLEDRSAIVFRVSIDGFHRPREIRYRRGRDSPVGFLEDSFDVEALVEGVLAPAGPGGDRTVVASVFDHRTDAPTDPRPRQLTDSTIVLLDGIFLNQPTIVPHLDLTVWLEVPFAASVPRLAARDGGSASPTAATNRRYVEGQQLYLARDRPRERASIVIDNTDWSAPRLIRSSKDG